jgi:hypothetical protein
MTDIGANYRRLVEAVAKEAERCGRRPQDITIVVAAKTRGPDEVRAAVAAGAQDIGENYVQEARAKMQAVAEAVRWHLIGHLQRNKAKAAVRLFTLIHTLDSAELARELDRKAERLGLVARTLIEVNIGGEKTKSGVPKEDLEALIEAVSGLSHLRVEGLMAIPPYSPDPEDARPYFRELAELRERFAGRSAPNVELRELSMGMTEDYRVAIQEGATIVRIGRLIFGDRP